MVAIRSMLALLGFLALTLGIGYVGGLATERSDDTWYRELELPAFAPPDEAFGPVWTLLYAMMALAAWRIWRLSPSAPRRRALLLWLVQLVPNLAWPLLFFGLRSPGLALLDIVLLLALIALTTVALFRLDRLAGLLFVPYLAWVAYAFVLNAAIWLMN